MAAAPAAPPAGGRPRPLLYSFAASWDPSHRILAGVETIRLRNEGAEPLAWLWLRLWANDSIPGQADGCRSPNIRIELLEGARIARYAVACSAAGLRLAHALGRHASTYITLRFRIRVPTHKAQFGRSRGVDLIGRAVPILAVRDGHGWHLNPDTATGDPGYALTAAWLAAIRLPRYLDAASTGAELSNTVDRASGVRTIVAASRHARDFGLAIGRLARRTGIADGVRVNVLSSSSRARAPAAAALRNAIDAIRTYTRWYGPYGAPELDLVVTALGAGSQELPEIVFSDPDRGTVAHEVAHQWFYGIVGDDQYSEPWLDESFASWNEEQLTPGIYPCDLRRPLGADRGGLRRGLRYYERRPRQYVDVIYRGGACALTALERMLGRERFLGMLRTEVARYRWGVIHTPGFLSLLRHTDSAVARGWTRLVGL